MENSIGYHLLIDPKRILSIECSVSPEKRHHYLELVHKRALDYRTNPKGKIPNLTEFCDLITIHLVDYQYILNEDADNEGAREAKKEISISDLLAIDPKRMLGGTYSGGPENRDYCWYLINGRFMDYITNPEGKIPAIVEFCNCLTIHLADYEYISHEVNEDAESEKQNPDC